MILTKVFYKKKKKESYDSTHLIHPSAFLIISLKKELIEHYKENPVTFKKYRDVSRKQGRESRSMFEKLLFFSRLTEHVLCVQHFSAFSTNMICILKKELTEQFHPCFIVFIYIWCVHSFIPHSSDPLLCACIISQIVRKIGVNACNLYSNLYLPIIVVISGGWRKGMRKVCKLSRAVRIQIWQFYHFKFCIIFELNAHTTYHRFYYFICHLWT